MLVAIARVGLVLLADVPIQPLVPLPGVVRVAYILYEIVPRSPVVGIRAWEQVQEVGGDGIDLRPAKYLFWPLQDKGVVPPEFGS